MKKVPKQKLLEAMRRVAELGKEIDQVGSPLEKRCYQWYLEDFTRFMERLSVLEEKADLIAAKKKIEEAKPKVKEAMPVDIGKAHEELSQFMALWGVQSDDREHAGAHGPGGV